MAKRAMTIDELAKTTDEGFKKSDATVKSLAIVVDDLARAVARGFVETGERIESIRTGLHFEISSVKTGLRSEFKSEIGSLRTEMHAGFASVRSDISKIHDEIKEIRAGLDYLKERTMDDDNALNSEVIKLEKRVSWLEKEIKRLNLTKA